MSTTSAGFLRLGLLSGSLFALLLAGLGFIGGSAIFDGLAIRRAPPDQVAAALPPHLSNALKRRATLVSVQLRDEPEPGGGISAEVILTALTPLYMVADLDKEAAEQGDDHVAFTEAVARRNRPPRNGAPEVPRLGNRPVLYAPVHASGARLKGQVTFRATKSPRRWALIDCWAIWNRRRLWRISEVKSDRGLAEIEQLRPRGEIAPGGLFLDDPAGQTFVRDYVEKRKAFIKAVGDREWRTTERVVDEAVRSAINLSEKHPTAFSLKSVTMTRPTTGQPTEAAVEIEQKAELFRESNVDVSQQIDPAVASAVESAKKFAAEFLPGTKLTPPPRPVLYESVSPAGATLRGTVRFALAGTAERPTIENVAWQQEPTWPVAPILTSQQAREVAVFQTVDPALRSVKHFAAELETYAKNVNESVARLERRWGSDREAWKIVLRAISAHGGHDAIGDYAAFTEEVIGRRVSSEGKEYSMRGTRRVWLPFRWREDFAFSSDKVSLNQTEALDRAGFWRSVDERMNPIDLKTPEGVAFQRRMWFAKNILWHLAAETGEPTALSRPSSGGPHAVVVSTREFPDCTVTFDSETGRVATVTYVPQGPNASRPVEIRYAEFKKVGDAVRPTKVALHVDGKFSEEFSVVSSQVAASPDAATFRNPYSPAKPFRGDPSGRTHALRIVNGSALTTAILICIDDDPETVALGANTERTIRLPEGDHELAIVSWTPQLSLKHQFRIESKPLRFHLQRNQVLTIATDRLLSGSLRWELK